jgi:hypothetical protein
MREVSAPIPQAGDDRRRAEHDGVEANRGDQEKDRPPPVIGRNFQTRVEIQNEELRIQNHE